MPLLTRAAPPQGSRLVAEAVAAMSGLAPPHARTFRALLQAPRESLGTAAPHPVYQMDLADLAAGRSLRASRQVGWRYLILGGQQVVAAAQLPARGARPVSGGAASINVGPFVEGTRRAIEQAEQLPTMRRRTYVLTLLHVPGLFVMALWLRTRRRRAQDILIPIAPLASGLAAEPYGAERFCRILAPAASKRLAFDSAPR
jgi:hypothetical protein